MENQSFVSKAFRVIVIFFIIKLIFIFAYSRNPVGDIVFSIIVFVVLLMLVSWQSSDSNDNTNRGAGSNSIIEDSLFFRLQQKYRDLAEKYENENKHKNAAQVYLKLLKSPYEAAEVLERGKFYNESAVIYHKKLENKVKAAECYEKGKSYQAAINLYLEQNEHEKLGDIYRVINKEDEAVKHYNIVVDEFVNSSQYVKASLLLRKKMNNKKDAQSLLLKGWKSNLDAKNCLNNYFANIEDFEVLAHEIQSIYKHDCPPYQLLMYLDLLKIEFKRNGILEKPTREIAYEIIAQSSSVNKNVLDELQHFKPNNQLVKKDIMKFKMRRA